MWQQRYTTLSEISASGLWQAIADVSSWSDWDDEIEWVRIAGSPQAGAEFVLKPKGAPDVKLTIEEFKPPHRFVDVTQFPLAQMRTIHEFVETSQATEIRITIQVWGILGFLWKWIVGQKQADGLPAQTQRFIHYANSQKD